jgi:hypothetical protein
VSGKSCEPLTYSPQRVLEGEGWKQRSSSTVTLLSISHHISGVSLTCLVMNSVAS